MSASLTLQVRLGFSLGWRIWTPNEVGFYAKTLAHTFFIFTILKSKLLKKMIWVVNYSIFISKKKYLVFLEFLEFGLKSKEERTRWKKIIYLSLVIQDWNKPRLLTKPMLEGISRITQIRKFIKKNKSMIRKSIKIKKFYAKMVKSKTKFFNKAIVEFKKTLTNIKFKKSKKVSIIKKKNTSINKNWAEYLGLGFAGVKHLVVLKKSRQRRGFWIALTRLGFKKKRISKRYILKNIKNMGFKKKKYIIGSIRRWSKKKKQHRFINKKNKISRKFGPVIKIFTKKNIKKIKLVNHISSIVGSGNKTTLASILTFRSVDVRKKDARWVSLGGGPRKRFYRNIKRSYKGKFIVSGHSLIWFWEKISRMLTYYIRCVQWGIV